MNIQTVSNSNSVAPQATKVPRLKMYGAHFRKVAMDRKKVYPHGSLFRELMFARMPNFEAFLQKNPTCLSAKLITYLKTDRRADIKIDVRGVCCGSSIVYLLLQQDKTFTDTSTWSNEHRFKSTDLRLLHLAANGYLRAIGDAMVTNIDGRLDKIEENTAKIEKLQNTEDQEKLRKENEELLSEITQYKKEQLLSLKKPFPEDPEFEYMKVSLPICELVHKGYKLLLREPKGSSFIEKDPENPDAFFDSFDEHMKDVFEDSTDLLLSVSMKEGEHAIGIRPQALRLYDAMLGEIRFHSKEEMISDLKNYLIRNKCTRYSFQAWLEPQKSEDENSLTSSST